jgi:cell division protein FtsB
MAQEAQEAKAANEVAGEEEGGGGDASWAVTNLFADLKVEKKSAKAQAAEKKLREEQVKKLSEEQRSFLEKRARMRREQSGAR